MSLNEIILDVEDKWVEDGTKYAEKSWPSTFNRMGKANIYERMRNIVKGIIPQSAIEDLLEYKNIHYETKDKKRWFEINRYDILVNGIKYDIKSNFIDTNKAYFRDLSPNNCSPLLDCSVLVPTGQLHARTMRDDDIYIFCFMTGDYNNLLGYDPKDELYRKTDTIDGKWILHGFWGYEFTKPPRWTKVHGKDKLGHILLSSTSDLDINKEFLIGGTREEKEFSIEKIKLNGSKQATTREEFFQLFFIRVIDGLIPDGTIILESESDEREVIEPVGGFETQKVEREIRLIKNDWDDIWIYNGRLYFVGYMTKREFKSKSEEIERFDKTVIQFEPQVDNNRLHVTDLHPISDIL